MTKSQKINEEIAKYFGFEKWTKNKMSPFIYEGKKMPQWTYPKNWYMAQGGVPNFSIPDFLTILEDYMKLIKKRDAAKRALMKWRLWRM